jgi:hypothetical protein
MWRRVVPALSVCALVAFLVMSAKSEPPPAADQAPAAQPVSGKEAGTVAKTATSRVSAVTVYPNSALITREVDGAVPARTGSTRVMRARLG